VHRTGHLLVGAGVSLLLSRGCAVAGGALGAGEKTRKRHTTAPMGVPAVTPPLAPTVPPIAPMP